jgi:hypothetical protein
MLHHSAVIAAISNAESPTLLLYDILVSAPYLLFVHVAHVNNEQHIAQYGDNMYMYYCIIYIHIM